MKICIGRQVQHTSNVARKALMYCAAVSLYLTDCFQHFLLVSIYVINALKQVKSVRITNINFNIKCLPSSLRDSIRSKTGEQLIWEPYAFMVLGKDIVN